LIENQTVRVRHKAIKLQRKARTTGSIIP